jgi:hypothetical protein
VAPFGRALALNPAWTTVRLDLGLVSLLRVDVDATAHFAQEASTESVGGNQGCHKVRGRSAGEK